MNTLLFTIGDVEITLGMAAIAGIGLAAAALITGIVMYFRRDRERAEEAAETVSSTLRASFREHIDARDRQVGELKAQLVLQADANAELQEANTELRARAAAIEAQMTEQGRQEAQNLERFMAARQQMSDEFKALAGEVLKSHGETFSKQNREQVDLLLKPLSEKIVEFQSGLMRDRAEMGQRIQNLMATSMTMSQEAHALTNALKGNAQVQGAWGEMVLSTILERSGLREGQEFVTQQSHTSEDGRRLRTDVEIRLPNGDVLIVDSKVSLNAFDAYINTDDAYERAQHLKAHTASLRSHIKTLAGKEYHRHAGSGIDFVFLFVPIESAFSAAVSAEPALLDYALSQGVVLTTPTTLMSALRTVRNVWDVEKRQQNAEQIAERAGALYDKVAGFLDSMDKIGQNLDRTKNIFNEARSQLTDGRGSVVRQVEMLRELGAKTNKQITPAWTEGSSEVVPITTVRAS